MEKPEALTRARACVYVHKPARRRHRATVFYAAFAHCKAQKGAKTDFYIKVKYFINPCRFVDCRAL